MSDFQIRLKAFDWLEQQVQIHGNVLPWKILEKGFVFEDTQIHLVSQQGIFKPKIMELPISITHSWKSPYEDSLGRDNYLIYKYRGENINNWDNVGLRTAMKNRVPLIYFHGLERGKYVPSWPVYIIGDDPSVLSFKVAVDDMNSVRLEQEIVAEDEYARRRYITSKVRVRLHQSSFRERVLKAYQSQCALCRLKHIELLDAAHIIPDSDPEGRPEVTNGISLCKLHHAAFDSYFIGLTPDYTVEVREDILDETDGPMLQHGLKELHKRKFILPTDKNQWPNKDNLDQRYIEFLNV